jgi:uncharacterized protein YukE
MEIGPIQDIQAKMVQYKETMLNELTALTSQINQTVGTAWQGNSATEFKHQYNALRDQITQQLDALEQMAQALQKEITQWNETASRMG